MFLIKPPDTSRLSSTLAPHAPGDEWAPEPTRPHTLHDLSPLSSAVLGLLTLQIATLTLAFLDAWQGFVIMTSCFSLLISMALALSLRQAFRRNLPMVAPNAAAP